MTTPDPAAFGSIYKLKVHNYEKLSTGKDFRPYKHQHQYYYETEYQYQYQNQIKNQNQNQN